MQTLQLIGLVEKFAVNVEAVNAALARGTFRFPK
jgi:hypothetical protein